jgi:hypothetical protein
VALFLETYTIPHDLPADDLVYALRRVNRKTDVDVVRCAYNLSDGKVWSLTRAESVEQVREAAWVMPFAFTLDAVIAIDPAWQESERMPLPLDERQKLDAVIVPDRTTPAEARLP